MMVYYCDSQLIFQEKMEYYLNISLKEYILKNVSMTDGRHVTNHTFVEKPKLHKINGSTFLVICIERDRMKRNERNKKTKTKRILHYPCSNVHDY